MTETNLEGHHEQGLPRSNHPSRHKRLRWTLGGLFAALGLGIFFDSFVHHSPRQWPLLGIAAIGCLALSAVTIRDSARARAVRLRLLALSFGLLIAFLILECYLRLLDPFPMLTRGGRISLPVNHSVQFHNDQVPGLDPEIHVSYNSLGFRGPEPPAQWNQQLTLLCIGGSTTQCYYLSDGHTWPDRLSAALQKDLQQVWVNNAGIDGHSTFGHLHLVDQYVAALRPKVVLLYVGLNDVGRTDLNEFDRLTRKDKNGPVQPGMIHLLHRQLLQHSDSVALIDNFRRQQMAARRGLTHFENMGHTGLQSMDMLQATDQQRQQWLDAHDPRCLAGYKNRLESLVQASQQQGCKVVLMTQPVLYGSGIDEKTNIDLERIRVSQQDGWTQWKLLSQYNQATIQVAQKLDLPVIDIASRLPKSSTNYYDLIHYTNDGAEAVASIIHSDLSPLLQDWFPEFAAKKRP